MEFHDNLFWFTLAPNLTHSHVYTLLLLMDGSDFSERVEGEKQHCVRLLIWKYQYCCCYHQERQKFDVIFLPPQYIHETSREGKFEKSLLFQPSRDRGPTNNKGNFILIDIFPYVTTTHLPDLPTHPDNLQQNQQIKIRCHTLKTTVIF